MKNIYLNKLIKSINYNKNITKIYIKNKFDIEMRLITF